MRSGGRPAVSTTQWVPSCDSRASIYRATAGWSVWPPWLLVCHAPLDRPMKKTRLFFFCFCLALILNSWHLLLLFSLTLVLLHSSSDSIRPEWQLAMGKPIRGWTWRPTLPLLSDLAEHATALHRFGAAPRGQRGQVSSVWVLIWSVMFGFSCRCKSKIEVNCFQEWQLG